MAEKIQIDQLAETISRELSSYTKEIADGMKKAVDTTARECRKELIETSPVAEHEGKHYRDGWTVKTAVNNTLERGAIVYNKTKPGLAHLLEKGHALRNGGRAKAQPHIGPVEKKGIANFERRCKEVIERAGR